MVDRRFVFAAGLTLAASLVACGGGGGGTKVPSGPATPTPVPTGSGATATPKVTATPAGMATTLPSASPLNPSTYTVDSNPEGVTVTIDSNPAGTTGPLSPAPLASYGAHTVSFSPKPPSTAAPFVINLANNGDGPHALYYNQVTDTSGKVTGGLGPAALRRAQPAAAVPPSVPRRFAAGVAGRPMFASGRIAVKYDASRFGGSHSFAALEAAHGIVHAQTLVQSGGSATRVLTLPAGTSINAALRAFSAEPGVLRASAIALRYPAGSSAGAVYPNDTYFYASNNGQNNVQWYLYTPDAEDAWGYVTESPLTAGTAPIAVIDTGYDPNQTDLASGVTASEKIVNLTVYNFPGAATDTDGHGTFLSGLASATTNNGKGFAGMAYNAPLLEYKIFPDGLNPSADTSDEAAAIYSAVAAKAKVILMALQGSPNAPDPVEAEAVEFAIQNGVAVVVSSGDDGGAALDFPAGYDGVISVGASAVNDASTPGVVVGSGNYEFVPQYSNFGTGLGLVAPGGCNGPASGFPACGSGTDSDVVHFIENLYTTQPYAGNPVCANPGSPPDCYIAFTGTSPAAALVAGTASLMLTVNPALTPAQVAQMLYASTDVIGGPAASPDPHQGHGRLNAQRAVAFAAGDPSPEPAIPSPRPIQLVAFAYTNTGAALPVAPAIVDTWYTTGVQVNADGTFRIADVPKSLPGGKTTYKIGVWLSLVGDGKVHAGDFFATSSTCQLTGPCGGTTSMTLNKLASNATTLP